LRWDTGAQAGLEQPPKEEDHVSSTDTARLVTGVDFVSLPTRDLEAAIAFYRDVLGLEEAKRWQRPGEEALGCEFETGTVTLALVVAERIGLPTRPTSVPVALHVDDVAAARSLLESRGVTFLGDTIDTGVCHMANFRDPDGNALMLHHRYAPPGPPPA
jgi:catechol 2,3-dioxygenase-like lactoylglutathione lyase family enzyme